MSLVGTRPILPDELEQYELHHRATISIEWIFNYFRAYFSFESDDEDSYGMIENNKENQEFSNYFRKLKPEE